MEHMLVNMDIEYYIDMSVCSPYKNDPFWNLTKDFFTLTASEADF